MFLNTAHIDREEEAADSPARGRKGAEGEPGSPRTSGLRDPGQLPAGGLPHRLRALCQDEVCAHHRAAQAGGQNQTGRRAAQVSDRQSAHRAETLLLKAADADEPQAVLLHQPAPAACDQQRETEFRPLQRRPQRLSFHHTPSINQLLKQAALCCINHPSILSLLCIFFKLLFTLVIYCSFLNLQMDSILISNDLSSHATWCVLHAEQLCIFIIRILYLHIQDFQMVPGIWPNISTNRKFPFYVSS